MIPFSTFQLNVKSITELSLSVVEGMGMYLCPLKWLPGKEPDHE